MENVDKKQRRSINNKSLILINIPSLNIQDYLMLNSLTGNVLARKHIYGVSKKMEFNKCWSGLERIMNKSPNEGKELIIQNMKG